MKKFLLGISSLMTFAITPIAQADCILGTCASGCMSVPCGWYLEASVGSSHVSGVDWPGESSSSGIGGQAAIGYKFMPYLALELGGYRYQNTSIKVADTKIGIVKNFSGDLAFKGILPFASSGFEIFAKGGVTRTYANFSVKKSQRALANAFGISGSNHSKTNTYYAAGLAYYLMPEFALYAQWSRANGDSSTGNMELISAGVNFIFD